MGFYNLALFLCPRDESDCTVSNSISLGVIGASWSSVTLMRASNLKQEKAVHVVAGFTFFLFFFFLRNKHTHKRKRKRGSNTKAHHNSTQKPW